MDDEEKQRLLSGDVVCDSQFKDFTLKLTKIVENTDVLKWKVEILKLFEKTADNDILTKRLFKHLQSIISPLPYEVYFVLRAYDILDNVSYKLFLSLMLECVNENTTPIDRQIIGSRMMDIVKGSEDRISRTDFLQNPEESVQLQAFRKFQFWFEMFLSLDRDKYTHLLKLTQGFATAFSNEDRIYYIRSIVMVIFGLNKYLTKKFLDYFLPARVHCLDSFLALVRQYYQSQNSPMPKYRSRHSKPTFGKKYTFQTSPIMNNNSQFSVTPFGPNYSFQKPRMVYTSQFPMPSLERNNRYLNTQTVDNPSQFSTSTVGQNHRFQDTSKVENPFQFSTAMVEHNPQFQDTSMVDNPSQFSTATIQHNPQFQDTSMVENLSQFSSDMVEHYQKCQDTRTVDNPSPFSTATVEHNHRFQDTRMVDNPSQFSTGMVEDSNQFQDTRTMDQIPKHGAQNTTNKYPNKHYSSIQSILLELGLVAGNFSKSKKGSVELGEFSFDSEILDHSSSNIAEKFETFDNHASVSTHESLSASQLSTPTVEQNNLLQSTSTMDNSSQFLTATVKHNNLLQNTLTMDNSSQFLTAAVDQNNHLQSTWIVENSSQPLTATVGQNYMLQNTLTGVNSSQFLIVTVEPNNLLQKTLVDNSSQLLPATFGQYNPFQPVAQTCPWILNPSAMVANVPLIVPNFQILNLQLPIFQPCVTEIPFGQSFSTLDIRSLGNLTVENRDLSPQNMGISSVVSAAPAELPQSTDQEPQTTEDAPTVSITPIKSPTKNPSPIKSTLSDLSLGADLPLSTEDSAESRVFLFDSEILDHSSLNIASQSETFDSHASVSTHESLIVSESQSPNQEAQTANDAFTVPVTPIKSPTKNPPSIQSTQSDLNLVVDNLPLSTEDSVESSVFFFDSETSDHSPLNLAELFETLY